MNLAREITRLTGKQVLRTSSQGGGCIAQSFVAELEEGPDIFVKHMPERPGVLEAEAAGLRELGNQSFLSTPRIVAESEGLLIMEWIPTGPAKSCTHHSFGQNLARIHRMERPTFGGARDNYIGATPQRNLPPTPSAATSWPEFFWVCRIEPQLREAVDNRRDGGQLRQFIRPLESALMRLLDFPNSRPSLIHGDLWSGNFLINPEGKAVLIDPAVSWSDREAEFGILRLFGGFPADFFRGYEEEWPLESGFEERLPAYILYHLLNHLNLFGSGYLGQVLSTARELTGGR